MDSTFSWLDTSEADRRRAIEVIDILRQKETLDELGLGSVRDTIADFLAPGTSTIQRRARYFFFIPWIYLSIERNPARAAEIASRARRAEIALIEPLAASADPDGTIGIEARASLKRLPSAIYWAGLGRLGFRLFPGSQDQYHRVVARGKLAPRLDDAGDVSLDGASRAHWHPRLPAPPSSFPGEASFQLSPEEAAFFKDQLRIHANESLLRFLVERGESVGELEFPWMHPATSDMPNVLRRWLIDGQKYSELMVGAAYLYNLMLAEALQHEEWIEHYRTMLAEWSSLASDRQVVYATWNREQFWTNALELNPRLPTLARQFSDSWIQLAVSSGFKGIDGNQPARALITDRERRLKGRRARLGNRDQLILWGGASGAYQMDYRWGITQTIVNDIVAGLEA